MTSTTTSSVGRTLQDVVTMERLDEGGFNRIFLITMHDGFQMIARIPYPVTEPKFYAVASEVATMAFLRAHDLPVPEVYGYSPTSDNAVDVAKGSGSRLHLASAC